MKNGDKKPECKFEDSSPYLGVPWRPLHDVRVRGLDPQALGRRPVHDYVYP